MKHITRYLIVFAVITVILTVIFRYFLSLLLTNQQFNLVFIPAILYPVGMFVAGYILGKKDGGYLPFNDIGFRFHLTAYLMHNLVSELWFILSLNSPREYIAQAHRVAVIWGIILLLHLFLYLRAQKNSIDHLDKSDLFE